MKSPEVIAEVIKAFPIGSLVKYKHGLHDCIYKVEYVCVYSGRVGISAYCDEAKYRAANSSHGMWHSKLKCKITEVFGYYSNEDARDVLIIVE